MAAARPVAIANALLISAGLLAQTARLKTQESTRRTRGVADFTRGEFRRR